MSTLSSPKHKNASKSDQTETEHSNIRVHPLASIAPFLRLSVRGEPEQWEDPWEAVPNHNRKTDKWAPGTATAVVRLENDQQNIYILTVGHAFYDMDPNRSKSQAEDKSAGRASNTVNFSWGEYDMNLVQEIGPHSISYGQYHRMGDKLNSVLDAGLAKVHDDIHWNNIYESNIELLTLDVWPLAHGNNNVYRIHDLTIPQNEFIVCPIFNCNFGTWNGQGRCVLHRVLLRVRQEGQNQNIEYNGTTCKACPPLNPCSLSA
jgi:hypothetical protein